MKVGIDEYPMDLLRWKEITTEKQKKNGTRIFQLPIKMYGKYIKVGSFKSGYVRRLECIGYRSDSSYQLNKRDYTDEYFQAYEWKTVHGEYQQVKIPGQYRKWRRRTCILIPNEEDRLKYLITYCLKNYYIKQANMIEDGKFVPKWKYEYELERQKDKSCSELADFRCEWEKELQDKIQDLKLELEDARNDYQDLSYRFEETAMELDNKEINKIGWRYGNEDEISVTINGHRYKVK